jgi:methylmalonyl-CoA mutase N-terminal domain/subunit
MYRGKKFTMRPIVGFGTPEDANKRIHFLLKHGATGLNLVFDLPTKQGYDSDHPYAKGQVGLGGTAIDTVEDMKALLKDIPLDKLSISLTTCYPSYTMALGAMFLVAAEEMGYRWEELRGTVQNEPVMEAVVEASPETLPPRAIFKIHVDNVEFLRKRVPKFNYATYLGYNLREAGVDEALEVAVAFSTALEASLEMMRRGHSPDDFLDRAAFYWSAANDFFADIAKMRAARRLWYKLTKYVLGASKERSWLCRFHVQTSGYCLTREEPLNNIARATLHTLAAVLGGAQSIHPSAYDEAYSIPSETAHLVSLRIQQIIQEETGIIDVVDPLAGSFYVEWLTNEIEKEIVKEMDVIWKMGGIVKAIESGWLHRRIAEFAHSEQELIEQGAIKVVGVNVYRAKAPAPPIDVFKYPEDAEERQRKKLEAIRRSRSKERVENALAKIKEAVIKGENLFPYVIDAVRERATEGEVLRTFREVFGTWRPRIG